MSSSAEGPAERAQPARAAARTAAGSRAAGETSAKTRPRATLMRPIIAQGALVREVRYRSSIPGPSGRGWHAAASRPPAFAPERRLRAGKLTEHRRAPFVGAGKPGFVRGRAVANDEWSERMNRVPALCLLAAVAAGPGAVVASPAPAPAPTAAGRHFEWTTRSPEAKRLLAELQSRIESFQFGAANVELGKKLVAADPSFAMGEYYLSAVLPDPDDSLRNYQKSRELARTASDGERRFIEAMSYTRLNQGVDFAKSIPPLEALAQDYPGERLIYVILGQLENGDAHGDKALVDFQKARALGPSPRVNAFIANDDLLKGEYARARASLEDVEKSLPKGSVPFPVRFGITFSHIYEGDTDAALRSLETYLAEYKAGGLDQQFPE